MAEIYKVWRIKYRLAMQDPHMEGKRYHHAIYVETAKGVGTIHHVIGDITSSGGMVYQSKPTQDPTKSGRFKSKDLLGYTNNEYYPGLWEELLSSVPTPPQQKAFNIATMRTEPFKILDPLTFYEPGEPQTPLMKCTEWTEQIAIPALLDNEYMTEEYPAAAGSSSKRESKHKTSTSSKKKGSGSGRGKGKRTLSGSDWEWDDNMEMSKYWNPELGCFVYWDENYGAEKYESEEGWVWL